VRVLLDENLPHDLIAQITSHDVLTVQGLGWSGGKNGDLLGRAGGLIDAFVTMDRKLEREHLLPLVASMLEALQRTGPGLVDHVGV
jgi:hypothetical protein